MAITFKRTAPHEARIYDTDGDCVGEVHRQPNIIQSGEHYFVVHLFEDDRGPVRVHERSRVREVAEQRLASHPLF